MTKATIRQQISDWTVRLEFVNRYKNLFIVFIQVTTFCGVFGVNLKNSVYISGIMMILYFLTAYVVDKTGLRKAVGKSDFDRNGAWLEMLAQLNRIEYDLKRITK